MSDMEKKARVLDELKTRKRQLEEDIRLWTDDLSGCPWIAMKHSDRVFADAAEICVIDNIMHAVRDHMPENVRVYLDNKAMGTFSNISDVSNSVASNETDRCLAAAWHRLWMDNGFGSLRKQVMDAVSEQP